MTHLTQQLDHIVNEFVSSVLDVMRGASLSDLVAAPPPRPVLNGPALRSRPAYSNAVSALPTRGGGRRRRSTAAEVRKQKEVAFAAARSLGAGFRKGDVMRKANSPVDLGRALALLVRDGKLVKKGDRRKARYWVK